LNVTNQQGVMLGVISEVFETGANDVIVVKNSGDGKERLLPFVDQTILDVSIAEKTMSVDWPVEWDE
jgi:16S rRNA processing protein RimM